MSRSSITVREAVPEDAPALLVLWADLVRSTVLRDVVVGAGGSAVPAALSEAEASIARLAAEVDRRLVVAELDGEVAGGAMLQRVPVTPLHSDDAVQVSHLVVAEPYRRHGVGRALVESAVTWAEEKEVTYVAAAVTANDRDANRYLARLGLSAVATLRAATVAQLRAKLPPEPPACARTDARTNRSVGQVLALRRAERRARSRAR